MPQNMKRGDYVKTWFDNGMGGGLVLGRVIKAGPATYTVRWESGIQNRCAQGYHGVELITNPDLLNVAKRQCGDKA